MTRQFLGSSVDRGGPGNHGRGRRHRPRARRCTRDSRRAHRLGRHAGAAAGNVVVRACRDRCARPVDHSRADRMPHAPRVRRRPQQRVRGTITWCDLRRHRTRGRRNRLDDARHASCQRRGTARTFAASRAGAGERRRDDAGSEVGLRARPRERIEDAARRATARRATRHRRRQDVSRRACAAAGVREPAGRLRASRVR